MSITKSYNKHTDTYYAYETTYEWNEQLQKKIQKKVCIGKYDPVTGEVIPNAKRGRPSKYTAPSHTQNTINDTCAGDDVSETTSQELNEVLAEIKEINSELKRLSERMVLLENKLLSLQK